MGYEPLLPEPNSPWSKLKQKVNENFPLAVLTFVSIPLLIVILFFIGVAIRKEEIEEENYVPNITIPSMELTVFLLYKDVTIATSSIESYKLIPLWPQLLNVSSIASKGDIDGLIVKDIMEDIKERGEIRNSIAESKTQNFMDRSPSRRISSSLRLTKRCGTELRVLETQILP
ncbi:hypothetical protein AALP_AA3G080900 [Arabis alpina]|uniref:Uncharacterized protein n=1 Tax=Arabis alpina TaxID=50452 RepID=A0A087H7T7_ARAAL|nr:hypothetical protein AALP_AA3G080900 [Arabis alpina]